MQLSYFHVDAFATGVFTGNPAGVCLLDEWLDDALLQRIAAENNLSETAFLVGGGHEYQLRWFTPKVEIDLCGHATLASAFVLATQYNNLSPSFTFHSRSGPLQVFCEGELFTLDFPARPGNPMTSLAGLAGSLGAEPVEVLQARDLLVVLESEERVRSLSPDLDALAKLDVIGVIVTAKGDRVDFVSRFFAPRVGVPEDPVTGSAHCTLIPYWSERLGKEEMLAFQVSARGGELQCTMAGDRVKIGGRATLYMQGSIHLP